MPELPEVQTIIDALISEGIVGKHIEAVSVFWPKTIATSTPHQFRRQIQNKTILRIQRHGKFIVFGLSDRIYLAVHLRMTGRFELVSSDVPLSRHVHIVMNLYGGQSLMFHDTRKFGRFYLTKEIQAITGSLGPEPLSSRFTAKLLGQKLGGRHRQVKPLLLDQTFLAGLGNIYVDEALWKSRIHPRRPADSLCWAEVKALHRAIRHVLRQGLRNAGTSLGEGLGNYSDLQKTKGRNSHYLKVFRRAGQACFQCGQQIERIVVGQRGTHICNRCQK